MGRPRGGTVAGLARGDRGSPPPDAQTAPLGVALDGKRMASRLRSVLGADVEVAAATLRDGKPGARALVSYVIGGPGGRLRSVFGKVYPEPGRARQVHDRLTALEALFAGHPDLGVPRPLGLLDDPAMVVYAPAPGRPVDELLGTDEAPGHLARAAAWLAVLHRSRLALGRTFRLDEELVNLRAWADVVATAHPGAGRRAHALCDRLDDEAATLDLRAPSPIHKDFHTGHAIVDPRGTRLAVVDVDEMRHGEPDLDLAHGCVYVRLTAHRTGLGDEHRRRLEDVFLDAYAERTGWVRDGRLGFFGRYTALKIAKQLSTARGPRPRPSGRAAERELDLVLDGGMDL